MNEIGHILGYAALCIVAAALFVFVMFAAIATEFDQGKFITSVKLRRVLWAVTCIFWAFESAFFLLDLVWKPLPGKLIIVSLATAIVITGVMAIRGFRDSHRRAGEIQKS